MKYYVAFLFKTMYKAILTVVLEIDAETEKECENILQEMDYDFNCIKMDVVIGDQLMEVDRIISQEITEQEIEKIC